MQRFIAVDWSGAVRGVRRKLWLAEACDGRLVRVECGRDREELIEHIVDVARDDRALAVGFDFAFSFPEWFLRVRGLSHARGLWSLAARHGEGWLAECAYPFWGKKAKRKPSSDATPSLYRRTESEHLPVRGIAPKSVFQIGGAGAVGTGSLRGMPWLARLQDEGFAIWPFDDACSERAAEPRAVREREGDRAHPLHRDRQQRLRLAAPLALEIYPRFFTGGVTKSSAVARRLYLAQHLADQDRALLDLVARSEDAFDAAVSALAMSAHARSIACLRAERDETFQLEGRIWRPLEDPFAAP